MKNNRFLSIFLLTICLLCFFLIIVGYTEKGFINIEKYKKIEKEIINYQITKNQLINKLGEPKYDLFVELPKYNFYSNVLVYETSRPDSSRLLIILSVREDDGNKIDSNINYLEDEKDMLWPGFEMTLEDVIRLGNKKSDIISLTKSCEEIITHINTSTGDPSMDSGGKYLNDMCLSNVTSYKNIKGGYLIIVFDLKSNSPIGANFLIRLFDRNGNYLSHFSTEEIYLLFPYFARLTTGNNQDVIDKMNPFVLAYNVNSIILPEIKYLEFGFILP